MLSLASRLALLTAVLAAAPGCAAAPPVGAVQAQRAARDAEIARAFAERASAYADLHRNLEQTLPTRPLAPTQAELDQHERSLARLLAGARGRARHGDMFDRETRAYFRRQIARALAGPEGAELKTAIMDDNPGRVRVAINGRYPDDVPLATMPSQVLGALPRLPADLEYRFLGDRLILLDVHARIVVDYVDNALPR